MVSFLVAFGKLGAFYGSGLPRENGGGGWVLGAESEAVALPPACRIERGRDTA